MRVLWGLFLISLSWAFCKKTKRKSLVGSLVAVRDRSLVVSDGGRRYEFLLTDLTLIQAGCCRVGPFELCPGDQVQIDFVDVGEDRFARRVVLCSRVSDCCHEI